MVSSKQVYNLPPIKKRGAWRKGTTIIGHSVPVISPTHIPEMYHGKPLASFLVEEYADSDCPKLDGRYTLTGSIHGAQHLADVRMIIPILRQRCENFGCCVLCILIELTNNKLQLIKNEQLDNSNKHSFNIVKDKVYRGIDFK